MPKNDPLFCPDGTELFGQAFGVGAPRAHVVIVHGYAEHSGRYQHVVAALNQMGCNVYCHDHRGHGKSPGQKALVSHADTLVKDLSLQIHRVKERAGVLPVFVLAHSMGAGVAVKAALTEKLDVRGYVFSGPMLKISEDISPLLRKIAPILGRLIPKTPVGNAGGSKFLSRDPLIRQQFDADPLCYKGLVRARTGSELLRLSAWCEDHMADFTAPFLILHGEADKLSHIEGSRAMYERAQSPDKNLRTFPKMQHEVLNELGKEEVLTAIGDWINARIP